MTCHRCGNRKITYYKQRFVNGVYAVTARCENGHIPEYGKPFYSKSGFDMSKLPLLNSDEEQEQPRLFDTKEPVELKGVFGSSLTRWERLMGKSE